MAHFSRIGLLSSSRFAAHFLDTLLATPPQKRQLIHWDQIQSWRSEWMKAHLELMILDLDDNNWLNVHNLCEEIPATKRPPIMIWNGVSAAVNPPLQEWNVWQILNRPFNPDAMLKLLETHP